MGNRLSKQLDNTPEDTYIYNTNRLVSTNTKTMAYDAVGNMTARGSDSFEYNDANRLEKATLTTGVFEYTYDYAGSRITKTSKAAASTYIYSPDGVLLAELDENGNTQVEYYYVNGQRIAFKQNDEVYYVHTSHLDYPLAITDSAGATVWQASHTPFGEIIIEQDLLTETFKARFPGQYVDAESGLYYNFFRDYDPELGRYIQSDPIGLAGGINTYAYVGGNPVVYTDITGLSRGRGVNRNPYTTNPFVNYQINSLITQIRRYDTTFSYNTARPSGPRGRYTKNDVTALQSLLRNAKNAGFCGPGASNAPAFPSSPGQFQHIFRNGANHVNPLTSASQQRFINLFRSIASNPANANSNVLSQGNINAGMSGYARSYNGGQVWVHVRNGTIQNAGVNRKKHK